MNHTPEKSSHEEYLEKKRWIKETVEKLNEKLKPEEGFNIEEDGEHFIVPVRLEDDKERKVYISAKHRIPLKIGEDVTYIAVEDVIEATVKFYSEFGSNEKELFRKSIEKLKKEREEEKTKEKQ